MTSMIHVSGRSVKVPTSAFNVLRKLVHEHGELVI